MANVNAAYKKDGFDGLLVAASENRENFTIAAAVGAGIGLATAIFDERSNLATTAITAIVGIGYVAGINASAELAVCDSDSMVNLGIVAGVGFGYTGIVGAVANRLLGDTSNDDAL